MKRAFWFAWAFGCTGVVVQVLPSAAQERSILLRPASPNGGIEASATWETTETSSDSEDSATTRYDESSRSNEPPLAAPEVVTISIDDLDAPIPPHRITDPSPIGSGVRRAADDGSRRIRVADTPNRRPTGSASARPLPQSGATRPDNEAARGAAPASAARLPLADPARTAPARQPLEDATPIITDEETFAAVFPVVSLEARGPALLAPGQVGRFTLKVSNLGDETVASTAIEIALPSHLKWVRSSVAGTAAGERYRVDLGQLEAQEEREIQVDAQAIAAGETRLRARVIAAADTELEVAIRQAKLEISANGPSRTASGELFGFRVTVTNQGQAPINGVQVLPSVPDGVRVQADYAAVGEVGWLAPGESREVELQFIADRSGRMPLRFVAAGAGVSQTTDATIDVLATTANDSARTVAGTSADSTSSAPQSVARSSQSSSPLQVELLGPATASLQTAGDFELIVTNAATEPAEAVRVEITIPPGLSVTTISRQADYDARSGRLTFELPMLEAQEGVTLQFKAVPVRQGTYRLVASATGADGIVGNGSLNVSVPGRRAVGSNRR